jgi:hypothetical protein
MFALSQGKENRMDKVLEFCFEASTQKPPLSLLTSIYRGVRHIKIGITHRGHNLLGVLTWAGFW